MSEPIRLPTLRSESAAAKALGISVHTLRRERQRGRISFTMIGNRVKYTNEMLAAYIEEKTCRASATDSRSATTGSTVAPIARIGADAGSTASLDRLDAHRSAQMILSRRK